MTYKETTEYLFHQIPMFERQGAEGYKEGLENTRLLDEHFGHPHQKFRTIHIAGTNGKGSVSHSLAALLQVCGYKVGLYTSPHLVDFRERIRVNGKMVSEDYVVKFVEEEKAFFEPIHPSFFEVTTAMAFKYFMEMEVDIAIIETGLGGRLDCTNIITPIVSVITNISYDHTQFLGDTLEKIAAEKAGIIKRGIPVVIGEVTPETRPVFLRKAQEMEAPITFAEDQPEIICAEPIGDGNGGILYETRHGMKFRGELSGDYQIKNTNTLMWVIGVLMEKGYLGTPVSQHHIAQTNMELEEALSNVCKLTGLAGRWQIIREYPLTICDTGHNVGGWKYIGEQLRKAKCARQHIIFGMVADKDIDAIMSLLPKDATYYFTKADNKRALPEDELEILGVRHGLRGERYATVADAYHAALSNAARKDLIFIGGSSYVVGDFLKISI